MDTDIFCVLCGGPFSIEPHVYNIDPASENFQWIYDVQILGNFSALHTRKIATSRQERPPNMSQSDDIFLSENIRWDITDADCFRLGSSYYRVLTDDPDDGSADVLFPLHSACIQIGCRVLTSNPPKSVGSQWLSPLALLHRTLQSHFHYTKYFGGGIGHDLFGLYTSCEGYGPRSALALDELAWWGGDYEKFFTNPLEVSNLTHFIFNVLQATPHRNKTSFPSLQPARNSQGLEALPNELLDRITDFLPALSVIALHRTSRTLFSKVPLDNRFWRNYLINGTLLPHIWDLDEKKLEQLRTDWGKIVPSGEFLWDWKSLVRLLIKKEFPIYGRDQRLEDVPKGFWNRCRIWNILEEACAPSAFEEGT